MSGSSASSGCLPLISPRFRGKWPDLWTEPPRPPVLSPHPKLLPPPVPGPLPPPCPAISPAGSGSPSHPPRRSSRSTSSTLGRSFFRLEGADATTNPWSLRPPTGTEPTAAGSASPTGPGWSARSGPGSTPGTLASPAFASDLGRRPPAGTAPQQFHDLKPGQLGGTTDQREPFLVALNLGHDRLDRHVCPITRHKHSTSL